MRRLGFTIDDVRINGKVNYGAKFLKLKQYQIIIAMCIVGY
jgi:hypothetical protein